MTSGGSTRWRLKVWGCECLECGAATAGTQRCASCGSYKTVQLFVDQVQLAERKSELQAAGMEIRKS